MSSFIFVRHGKSQANQDKIIAAPDSPLTKEGEAQARKVGRELKKNDVTVVVSSPLLRARQTAEIIAKQLKVAEVQVIDDLRERGFGQLQNQAKEHPSEWYFTIDGESDVEPKGVLIARCEAALAKIRKLAETDKVVVVGHAVTGFYLQQVAAGKRFFDDFDPPKEMLNSAQKEVAIIDKIPLKNTSRESLVSLAALVLGALCLAAGIWLFAQRSQAPQPQGAKQQQIQLKPEDYQGDPNLQGAVQKQLEQQQGLQQQGTTGQSSTGTSQVLQPVTTGIPSNLQQ
jgi:broad specificity phosphatase PhoE